MNTSPLWHRAALLGSAWASLEIIVGSFLHNIRFPLAGTVLAALGVMLMVAGRRIWDQPGLLWRAGVVCALMKALSPSAVILGPMAGIMLEAFLMEVATSILGTTLPGVLIGGALATSVSLLQKAAGLIITYGTDVARLYAALVEAAATALSLEALGPVELFVLLLVLCAVLGMIAGLLGRRLARTARAEPAATADTRSAVPSFDLDNVDPAQRFSTRLLSLHIVLLPAGLFLLSALPLPLALVPIAVYVTASLLRYRRLVHRLGRIRLWVEFVAIALLAGFFLGNLDNPGWTMTGLGAGAEMIARAAFIIVSFASISVELRNPAVLRWFIRHGLGELSSALAVAFRALPGIIRVLDEDRALLRHPWTSLARVLSTAVGWVEALDSEHVPVVFLITGERASGKTTALTGLAGDLLKKGIRLRGFAAPAVFENQERLGYDLQDLLSGTSTVLCRKNIPPTGISQGPFHFLPEGFRWGTELLTSADAPEAEVLCIDELGPLELDGLGWSPTMDRIQQNPPRALILTVRTALQTRILQRWGLTAMITWRAGSDDPGVLADAVAGAIR